MLNEEERCLFKERFNKTYYYINETHIDKCSNNIENCEECENNKTCSKCKADFYIINNNTENCINISNIPFDEYYLNNDNTIYYSCNNSIYHDVNNCKKCSSKINCTLCQNGFTFIESNKSYCIEKYKLNNKYIEDPLDNSNYIKCENIFHNCETCNNSQCLSCKEEFIFINGYYSICELKSSLNMSDYFTNDNIMFYSCKEEKYKEREECQKIISNNTEILIPISAKQVDLSQYIEQQKNSFDNLTDIKIDPTLTNKTNNENINSTNLNVTEEITNKINNSLYDNISDFSNENILISTNNIFSQEISINSLNDDFWNNFSEITFNLPSTDFNEDSVDINQNTEGFNSTILPEETSTNSIFFELNELPKDNYSYSISTTEINYDPFFLLFILQVRLINNKLKVYVIISIKIENFEYIKISINLYKNNSTRNLQDSSSKFIDLYTNENTVIEPGKIIELTSKEEFDDNDRIVVNKNNNLGYELKVLNNDDNILDSQKNEERIQNGELPDFSNINELNEERNYYLIESSSTGCEFNLNSKTSINEKKQDLVLNFIEKDYRNNKINAKCVLSNENDKQIPCTLEKRVDNNYNLEPYAGFNKETKNIFYIQGEDDKAFKLSCQEEMTKSSGGKEYIIIILGALFVVIVLTVIITVICCKRKQLMRIGKDPSYSNDSFDSYDSSERKAYDVSSRKKGKKHRNNKN